MSLVITVTNADRVIFPETGHTKGDVVAYYRKAAERMLPHLARRPLTLRRYPRGIHQQGFFQKNAPAHYPPSFERVELARKGGVTIHPTVSTAEDLAYLANRGAIELHVPTVRAPDLFHPDRLVVDLDPPAGEVALARHAAKLVRDELGALGLPTVPMATGSKGYHVVAAIQPTLDLHAIATAMQQFAGLVSHRHPEQLTMVFRVARRGKRAFVDWLRNAYAATVVAPFSLRARPGASIAMPLEWRELDTIAPDACRLAGIEPFLERPDPLAALADEPVDPAPFVAAVGAAFGEAGIVLETFDRFRG